MRIHREVIAIRKNEKLTKEHKTRMSEIFLRTKEIEHLLADLYYELREVQLKIYGE